MEDDLVGMAWRAMSMLQKHLEANGAPPAPAARNIPAQIIPHEVAKRMQRDGIVPNCDGHHATEAPMPPHLAEVLLGRADDEGEYSGAMMRMDGEIGRGSWRGWVCPYG